MKTSPQLRLFPEQLVGWEALPRDCQHSLQELLSLLLELIVMLSTAHILIWSSSRPA